MFRGISTNLPGWKLASRTTRLTWNHSWKSFGSKTSNLGARAIKVRSSIVSLTAVFVMIVMFSWKINGSWLRRTSIHPDCFVKWLCREPGLTVQGPFQPESDVLTCLVTSTKVTKNSLSCSSLGESSKLMKTFFTRVSFSRAPVLGSSINSAFWFGERESRTATWGEEDNRIQCCCPLNSHNTTHEQCQTSQFWSCKEHWQTIVLPLRCWSLWDPNRLCTRSMNPGWLQASHCHRGCPACKLKDMYGRFGYWKVEYIDVIFNRQGSNMPTVHSFQTKHASSSIGDEESNRKPMSTTTCLVSPTWSIDEVHRFPQVFQQDSCDSFSSILSHFRESSVHSIYTVNGKRYTHDASTPHLQ